MPADLAEARRFWRAVFGDDRPVEVEIGPGRGEVILAFAAARPTTNFFGIERGREAAEAITGAAARRGLANVRVVAADARCVARFLPAASVAAYHIYFPDPWPKTRHRARRLVGDDFARDLARTLEPGGLLHVASDLPPVLADLTRHLVRAALIPVAEAAAPRPTTAFERKYAGAGTCYGCFARAG